MIHEILMGKTAFEAVTDGRKTHVLQNYNDAQYSVGDFLALNEITDGDAPVEHTGRCCLVRVSHICTGIERYLTPGTIILSVRPCTISDPDRTRDPFRDVYEVPVYCDPELEAIT